MKQILDGSSIIAVGGWNPQIFSPDWIKKHLCDDQNCQIELAVPVNSPATQPRLSFEGVHMFVNPARLELKPQSQDNESFKKCSELLKKILMTLNHTPITSFGVNLSFVSDGDHGDVIPKFVFNDIASFDADSNKLVKTSIQRAFKQQDDSVMNFTVSIENDTVVISFNYHHDVADANVCKEKLCKNIVSEYEKNSRSILETVYEIQVNAEE